MYEARLSPYNSKTRRQLRSSSKLWSSTIQMRPDKTVQWSGGLQRKTVGKVRAEASAIKNQSGMNMLAQSGCLVKTDNAICRQHKISTSFWTGFWTETWTWAMLPFPTSHRRIKTNGSRVGRHWWGFSIRAVQPWPRGRTTHLTPLYILVYSNQRSLLLTSRTRKRSKILFSSPVHNHNSTTL